MFPCSLCVVVDTSVVCSVGWTPANELFSVSDDRTIVKWGMDGEPENKPIVEQIDTYATGNLNMSCHVMSCHETNVRHETSHVNVT